MPVITINGPIGGGAVTIGQMVADQLKINFVDRLVFTQAARLVGSPVRPLIDKEQRFVRFRERLGHFLENVLERSAEADGEYYFGSTVDVFPPDFYARLAEAPSTTKQLDDKKFIEATTMVVRDLYQRGDVVIIGRGANVILADTPGVFHVGLLAPMEVRVETLMQREHLDQEEAQVYVEELEQARVKYFRKFFRVNPNDPTLYHMMLNMGKLEPATAAEMITLVHTTEHVSV